jgi:transposase
MIVSVRFPQLAYDGNFVDSSDRRPYVRQSPISTSKIALDESGGRALVESWRASGLSGSAYCREHGERPQKLHYWRQRLGYPIRTANCDRIPMVPPPAPPAAGFVQVMVAPTTTSANTDVEILVGGAVIRVRPGFDPSLLQSVITALSEQSC